MSNYHYSVSNICLGPVPGSMEERVCVGNFKGSLCLLLCGCISSASSVGSSQPAVNFRPRSDLHMPEFVLFALILFQLNVGCSSTTTSVVPADETPREVDLGKLSEGETPSYIFRIRNTSRYAFKVTAVQKSCGCQTANLAEETIVPARELLEVPYSLPTSGTGLQAGKLVINTDSTDERFKEITLTLRAEIPAKLSGDPVISIVRG